jgi:hypothetical protein
MDTQLFFEVLVDIFVEVDELGILHHIHIHMSTLSWLITVRGGHLPFQ